MDISLDTTLETERCTLRCVSDADVECVWTASRVPGFTDGMTWDPAETKEEIIEITKQCIERWKHEDDFCFSLCLQESGECIGRIVIRKKEGDGLWNIGYWMHHDFQGKGYMTEAVLAIVEWGFTVLQAQTITSEHASWNEASGKVLLRAGFTHIGHLPCGFIKHGKEIPEEEYAMAREQWGEKL